MNWEQVAEFLQGAGVAHLATATLDGWPHVSAVMPSVEGEVLWIGTRAKSRKARNIRANPRVALMWQPRAEIYLWGSAALVDDEGEKCRIWESHIFPFDLAGSFGTPTNPEHVFVKVEPVSALVLSQGPDGLTQQRWPGPPSA
jgi:general stress protein 26